MEGVAHKPDGRVLLLGATGFIGRRLLTELTRRHFKLILLVRSTEKIQPLIPRGADVEVIKGDLLSGEGLEQALDGADCAYYLVHSMGGRSITVNLEFAERDKKAARKFVKAANASGLKRVIYLGGLGEAGEGLSEHLRSRAEVAKILSSGKAKATVLRAAVIIGAGGASFEMLRYLVERLPIMICPKWIDTRIQPVAVKDVISYLVGCLENPDTAGKTFDICGPEVLTYREMMQEYAEARGLARRLILSVPVLTPQLAAYWVDLVTPVPSGIAHPLIEGLKTEVVCQEDRIDKYVPVERTPFNEAVKAAFREEKEGPGVTGF
jgi:uncharacterized protein YbjT (DUF2867 family)